MNIFIYFYKGIAYSFYSLSTITFDILNYFLYGIFVVLYGIFTIFKLCFDGVVIFLTQFFKYILIISEAVYSLEKKMFGINSKNKKIKNKNIVAKEEIKSKNSVDKIQKKENKNSNKEGENIFSKLSIVKDYKNRKEMKRQILLIELDPEATKKSDKRQTYIYEAKNPEGKFIKGTFDAFSKIDVHSYLLNEGYEVYDIKTNPFINFLYGKSAINGAKYKTKDLIFLLTQLSTYIRSGIPLIDSLRIFSKQERKESKKKVLQAIIYELIMGENFSNALEKQGKTFPKLLINMIRTAEMTGELPDTLDDMSNYYETMEKTRKEMISAMTYPTIIFVMAMAIVTFIMLFVIPSFVGIYADVGADLPGITKFVIGASEFLQKFWALVLGGLILTIGLLIYMYKKVKFFRMGVQYIIMKIPVVSKVVIYNEVTLFTKTFSSLLNHNVFITDSMEILSKITNNEIYKKMIFDTMTNLSKGESISKSFKNKWAFPIVAYEMLLTGEATGELGKMMGKVAIFYQEQYTNLVTQLKSFIEPIMISFLAFIVGGILLAVVIPMFSLYGEIGGIYDFTIYGSILHIWNSFRFIL